MVWFNSGHARGGAVGLPRGEGALGLALLFAGQRLSHRLGAENFCRWTAAAAARFFGDERVGDAAKRFVGVDVATYEKGFDVLPRAREEREKRGLTYAQMGEVLGLTEHQVESGAVQGYEAGMPARNGAVVRIYQGLQRSRLGAQTWLQIPRWTLARAGAAVVVHHNEFPRFIGKAVPEVQHKEQWRFAKAGMAVRALSPGAGLAQLIVSFVDHVPQGVDVDALLDAAQVELERFLRGADRGD